MFEHQGKRRTAKHNLQIATALSLVAGIVNVSGYLSIQKSTTNVTGLFALFIYDVTDFNKKNQKSSSLQNRIYRLSAHFINYIF